MREWIREHDLGAKLGGAVIFAVICALVLGICVGIAAVRGKPDPKGLCTYHTDAGSHQDVCPPEDPSGVP
jgi:hypothetical protein